MRGRTCSGDTGDRVMFYRGHGLYAGPQRLFTGIRRREQNSVILLLRRKQTDSAGDEKEGDHLVQSHSF